jgi:hypothetical protein
MAVRQRHVAGESIPAAVQCQRPRGDNAPVPGRRPRLDLPGHRLSRIKPEGIEVEDAHMRLVSRVGHRRAGTMDLDGAIVTFPRGWAVPTARGDGGAAVRARRCLRARSGERQYQRCSDQGSGGKKCELDMPCNSSHARPRSYRWRSSPPRNATAREPVTPQAGCPMGAGRYSP